jgi:hypothetical protein
MLFQISNKHHHYHNINSQAIFFCFLWPRRKIQNAYNSDSARHRSQNIYPPISQIVLKKISLIIKECPEEILIKLELS